MSTTTTPTSAGGAGVRAARLPLHDARDASERQPVSWRSLLLGLVGVCLICGLTPYNDFVVRNTYLVGNFLSVGLLLFFAMFVVLVNAPLHRFAPRHALGFGELAVAMAMVAVSCAVPSSGLMRYLPSHVAGLWYQAGTSSDYMRVMVESDPVDWIFPSFQSVEFDRRVNDPVVQYFWTRAPVDQDTFLAHLAAVPWDAWLRPALTWGVMVAATFGALLCMLLIVRRQWVENERLPFPIAQVFLSVIEPPERGRVISALFRSRVFWIAFAAVFVAHGFNGLHAYNPRWPEIPLDYNLSTILAEPPSRYAEASLKAAAVYFTVIGITFFLQTKVAFSLWGFYIIIQVVRMLMGTWQGEYSAAMMSDQMLGALLPYVAMILWIGRHHWAVVLGQMFRRPREDEPHGRYLPYRLLGWAFVACILVMLGWLIAAGVTVPGAMVIVGMILVLYLAVARIVAETGLLFLQLTVGAYKPWQFLAAVSGGSIHTTQRSFFMAGLTHAVFTGDQRETLAAYGANAIRVADEGAYAQADSWRRGAPFVASLAGALIVAYLVAGASTLYSSYTHAVTMDKTQIAPINDYGLGWHIKIHTLDPGVDYRPPDYARAVSHDQWLHFGIGAAVTAGCSLLRLRYDWWPLHPVGFLVADSYAIDKIWFSIFLGWLAKLVVVRFGGAGLFRAVRPLFIGLILGETGAAAVWLIVSLARNSMGLSYEPILLLPT